MTKSVIRYLSKLKIPFYCFDTFTLFKRQSYYLILRNKFLRSGSPLKTERQKLQTYFISSYSW
jgi:hypothetical protein